MVETPPRVYLLQGDDEFAMTEFVQSMKRKLGDDTAAEMNFQFYKASDLDWPSFEAAASSLPFLSNRRLVVLDQVEHFHKDSEQLERLTHLLEHIPDSTALLLIERSPASSSKRAKPSSSLTRWIKEHPDLCYIRSCETPHGSGFVSWLQNRVAEIGGSIEPDAAVLLSEWTQEDPRLTAQELNKLLDYVDLQRTINVDDVEQCTPYRGQSSIFALVDAIGQRQGEEALRKLHEVLMEDDASYAFAMILRQFRLIIRARDMIDSAKTPDHTVHRSKFVVKKVAAQARNFSLSDLENIYRELLEIDLRAKNGQMDLDVALDRLVSVIAA
jgi:DNA polymerase-3 subunit delta